MLINLFLDSNKDVLHFIQINHRWNASNTASTRHLCVFPRDPSEILNICGFRKGDIFPDLTSLAAEIESSSPVETT